VLLRGYVLKVSPADAPERDPVVSSRLDRAAIEALIDPANYLGRLKDLLTGLSGLSGEVGSVQRRYILERDLCPVFQSDRHRTVGRALARQCVMDRQRIVTL
jgi:hypothetical protein